MDTQANPLPATIAAALRYAIGILLPIGVQRGWWGESDAANISALVVAGATVAYGLWKTHQRQTSLVNAPAPSGRSPNL